MIRVVLPHHLRTLARVETEVQLDLAGPVTIQAALEALETRYPMLKGTIRDHVSTHPTLPYLTTLQRGRNR
jgi:molybdopterin synthase sulfur carrier subunit